MLKTQSKTISGLEITVTQFPAIPAFALAHKLVSLLGSVWGKVPDGSGIAGIGAAICASRDPDEMIALLKEVLACSTATCDGKQIPLNSAEGINAAFAGNMPAMLGAAQFAIEVNFSDFFGGALAGLSQAASAANPSRSRKRSPKRGQPTGS